MVILDACVLIAHANIHHPDHEKSLAILSQPVSFIVNELTLAEYLVKPAQLGIDIEIEADAVLREINARRAKHYWLTENESWDVRVAKVRAETGLKMPDAVVYATAVALGCKVAAFDGELANVARDNGLLFAP